jgi:hypothetical protein
VSHELKLLGSLQAGARREGQDAGVEEGGERLKMKAGLSKGLTICRIGRNLGPIFSSSLLVTSPQGQGPEHILQVALLHLEALIPKFCKERVDRHVSF